MEQYINKFNWTGVEFPTEYKHIDIFEENNPYGFNVHIFNSDTNVVSPSRISKKYLQNNDTKIIDLIYLKDNDNYHYAYIKNFSKLVSQDINKNQHAKPFICRNCFSNYPNLDKLKMHYEYCKNHDSAILVPYADKNGKPIPIKLKNYHKQMKIPVAYYADFECLTVDQLHLDKPDRQQKHIPQSYDFYRD